MIVGKEGIHTWAGGLVLNKRDDPVHYRVDEIAALRALPELAAEADAAIGRLGEVPRRGDRGGKSLGYAGLVIAQSLAGLRTAQGEFAAAFADTDEHEMVAAPHPAYAGADLPTRRFWARCVSCEADESAIADPRTSRSGGYEMPFDLVLRLSDPRYYHDELIEQFDDVASPVGGAGVPFSPGSAAPSGDGFQIDVDNPGEIDTDGVFVITGPQRSPVISNQTLGVFLRFRVLDIDAGHSVTVDFRRRRAYRTASGNNVRHTLDPSSTWWNRGVPCLVPGANVIRQRAYSVGVGARFDLSYRPADIA